MIRKYLLRTDRIRRIPRSFSWIDRRFLHDGFLRFLQAEDFRLYYFLTAVADQEGLSYWSDASISEFLTLRPGAIDIARRNLVAADLIAYEFPLYQVLSLFEERRHA